MSFQYYYFVYLNYHKYKYVIKFVAATQLFADVYYRFEKRETEIAGKQLRVAIEKLKAFQDEHSVRLDETLWIEFAHQKRA